MLARSKRGDGLSGVQLRGRAKDDGVDVVGSQRVVELGRGEGRTVFLGDILSLVQGATDDRGHLDAVDARQGVEVLEAKGSRAGDGDSHEPSSWGDSRIK